MTGPIRKDLVAETSTTTGTADYVLLGPVPGSFGFASIGDGNWCHYCAINVDANGNPIGPSEIGVGTYVAATGKLVRTAILVSTNGNAAVSWAAGTRRIELGFPASSIAALEAAVASPSSTQTVDAYTGITYNGSGQLTGYSKNGVAYAITYATVNSLSLPATKTGGGHTITYTYNSSGQMTGQTGS